MIAQLEVLKEKYGDIPVYCQESQDSYFEWASPDDLEYRDGTKWSEKGIYVRS